MIAPGQQLRSGALLAGSGLGVAPHWPDALDQALAAALAPLNGQPPHVLVLFASAAYADSYADLLREAAVRTGARELIGCSASGVIGVQRELEGVPALAALAVRLPAGSLLNVRRLEPGDASELGWPRSDVNGLLILADPFTTDVTALVSGLERAYPGVPLVGGLATGNPGVRQTHIFCGSEAAPGGAVVLGLGGSATLRAVVSQGCQPIGRPWTITEADGPIVRNIGNRPAYQVLAETVRSLEPEERQRAARNLLVGLAMDEYRSSFGRGDFLIRNLMAVDPSSGAIAIAGEPHVGQTLQFQIRDARAADEELRQMLSAVAPVSGSAALLFACNGRGTGLFGAPDHDARTVADFLGPVPLAGLFCNGEIGPVGRATYIHGFTASLGLIGSRADQT